MSCCIPVHRDVEGIGESSTSRWNRTACDNVNDTSDHAYPCHHEMENESSGNESSGTEETESVIESDSSQPEVAAKLSQCRVASVLVYASKEPMASAA